jgi:membrane associated rhomboid family serine protease
LSADVDVAETKNSFVVVARRTKKILQLPKFHRNFVNDFHDRLVHDQNKYLSTIVDYVASYLKTGQRRLKRIDLSTFYSLGTIATAGSLISLAILKGLEESISLKGSFGLLLALLALLAAILEAALEGLLTGLAGVFGDALVLAEDLRGLFDLVFAAQPSDVDGELVQILLILLFALLLLV